MPRAPETFRPLVQANTRAPPTYPRRARRTGGHRLARTCCWAAGKIRSRAPPPRRPRTGSLWVSSTVTGGSGVHEEGRGVAGGSASVTSHFARGGGAGTTEAPEVLYCGVTRARCTRYPEAAERCNRRGDLGKSTKKVDCRPATAGCFCLRYGRSVLRHSQR